MTGVDPVLAALSDVLVLKALERAATFGSRGRRRMVSAPARHRAYEDNPVPVEKVDPVLRDMFVLCPILASRYDLDVDAGEWMQLLDGYARALLMMGEPHRSVRLAGVLAGLRPVEEVVAWDAAG